MSVGGLRWERDYVDMESDTYFEGVAPGWWVSGVDDISTLASIHVGLIRSSEGEEIGDEVSALITRMLNTHSDNDAPPQ